MLHYIKHTLIKNILIEFTQMFYIYCYRNPLKNMQPFYIGKGKGNRFKDHLKTSSLNENSLKNSTIKKIINAGYEILDCIEIVKDSLTEAEAFALEVELIASYGRKNNGTGILTNLTDGGEGAVGAVRSEKLKEAISHTLKQYFVDNPEALTHTRNHESQKKNRGEGNGNSKLTTVQVLEIKELLKTKMFQKEIAKRYGISQMIISQIKNKQRWAHIE